MSQARWVPYPKQELALSRPEFEICYGGARGGGKTDAGLMWTAYDSDQPRLRGLVVRKNGIDLHDWISRARHWFENKTHGVRIVGNPPILIWPSGATWLTGHMKDEKAFTKYQGQEFQRILIEELELIPSEDQYTSLLASCRSTLPGIKAQAFSTTNPGNVGHTWIKRRFGLEGIPKEPIITKDERTGRMRIFVPATVEDNEALVKNDPEYVHFLNGLPDGLREQWRWGSWDDPIIRGAYYTLEMAQARRDARVGAVPFRPELSVHTWWDIGADMTSIGFVQFSDGFINFIDYYQNDSLGFPFYLAKLQEFRENRGYNYGIHHFPHDFERMEWGSGRNREEILENRNIDYEIVPRPANKQDAIDQTRILLARARFDQNKCAQLVDGLINYRKKWDEEKQTFEEKPVHDWASHPADMVSYVAISNHESLIPDKKPSELGRLQKEAAAVMGGEGVRAAPSSPEFSGPASGGLPTTRFHYPESPGAD